MHSIFIDGQAGTTGLRIHQYLEARSDLALMKIPEADRKNESVKYDFVRAADIVILCLPDEAARATVKLAANSGARILDASTAHRVHQDWTYGMPELDGGQRDKIRNARLVSNPGCYPTGFLLAVAPLVSAGWLSRDIVLTISAVSGYTGGGRKMVEEYEARRVSHPDELWYVRPYGLDMNHKHVPEMKFYAGLDAAPMFLPYVGHYPQGMLVSAPLSGSWFTRKTGLEHIADFLSEVYRNEPCVTVHAPNDQKELDHGKLEPQANNGTNRVDIFVFGSERQILLVSRLDNLGKGAAGAAVQNLNLMLGEDELCGLAV
jgi:N-acetyl-gamma-glutamyl-phosphate reductase